MLSVNLIPMPRREQRMLYARRKGWTIACAAYAVALGVGSLAWRAVWNDDARDLTREISIVHTDVDDATRSIGLLRASLADTRQVILVNRTVAGQPDWSLLMGIVGDIRGDEVVLNRCALETADGPATDAAKPLALRISGYGRSQGVVSQFVLRMEQTGLFDSVSLVKTNREPFLTGEAVAFKLDCLLKSVAEVNAAGRSVP